jgi:uncharacterized protein
MKTTRYKRGRFSDRYGAWALVLGASEGLGAAFTRILADRGMNLVLVARRSDLLERLAEECSRRFGVETRCFADDLAAPGFAEKLYSAISELEVGLVVYNAAYAPVGEFIDVDPADLLQAIQVNVRGPVALLRLLVPPMAARKRGAVVLMSSLAGNQGTPRIATYAASKAFNRVLAEGLWHELKERGIDVIACCAGAIRTPGYARTAGRDAPGTLDAEYVAERAIRALGRGPVAVPGLVNQLAAWVLGRLMPRPTAIRIMAGSTAGLQQTQRGKASS